MEPIRDIAILKVKINDNIIAQLQQIAENEDEVSEELSEAIKIYSDALIASGIEVFKVSTYYCVSEESIYIACYNDELTDYDQQQS